jgi:hypothetical protein
VETIKKYLPHATGILTVVIPLLTWIGNGMLEGAEHRGYIKAKQETNEEYSQALRDAIIYRAKYESCCTGTTD